VCDDCVRGPLRRVNYFPGQVLGVDDLTAEQRYHRDQVSVALRATHGGGVVCGLEVTPAAGGLQIAPGLAIDPCGREIIVPAMTAMKDPRQPIDDQGAPSGPAVAADVIMLSLVYAERADGPDEPGVSRTLETYRIDARPAGESPAQPGVDIAAVDAAQAPGSVTPGTRRQVATLAELGNLVAGLAARVAALEAKLS
jgi:hypothetical protein